MATGGSGTRNWPFSKPLVNMDWPQHQHLVDIDRVPIWLEKVTSSSKWIAAALPAPGHKTYNGTWKGNYSQHGSSTWQPDIEWNLKGELSSTAGNGQVKMHTDEKRLLLRDLPEEVYRIQTHAIAMLMLLKCIKANSKPLHPSPHS